LVYPHSERQCLHDDRSTTKFFGFYTTTYNGGWCFEVPPETFGKEYPFSKIVDELLQQEVRFVGSPVAGEVYFMHRHDSAITVENVLAIFNRHGIRAVYLLDKTINYTVSSFGKPKFNWL
jgi:hypothetical protein